LLCWPGSLAVGEVLWLDGDPRTADALGCRFWHGHAALGRVRYEQVGREAAESPAFRPPDSDEGFEKVAFEKRREFRPEVHGAACGVLFLPLRFYNLVRGFIFYGRVTHA
jgi:hypothetical protein